MRESKTENKRPEDETTDTRCGWVVRIQRDLSGTVLELAEILQPPMGREVLGVPKEEGDLMKERNPTYVASIAWLQKAMQTNTFWIYAIIAAILFAALMTWWDPLHHNEIRRDLRKQWAQEAEADTHKNKNDTHQLHVHKMGAIDPEVPDRLIFTISLDNDDSDSATHVVITDMIGKDATFDFGKENGYGNVLVDSGLPDWGGRFDVIIEYGTDYDETSPGWTRLNKNTPVDLVRRLRWQFAQNGIDTTQSFLAPHNGNDDPNIFDGVDTGFGRRPDVDAGYVRYSVICLNIVPVEEAKLDPNN